jgi:copper chaperone
MSDTIQLTVNGMTCKHCVAAVEKALAAVDGVDEVIQVTLEPGGATVKGNATTEALAAAIREAGYEVAV